MDWNFTFVKYDETMSKLNTEDLIVTVLYKIGFYRTTAKSIFLQEPGCH